MKKYIPHFRRTELFSSGGGVPEGRRGEQHSHVRGRTPVFIFEPAATSERVSYARTPAPTSRYLTLSFGCRTRKRHPCKGLAYLNVRAPPSCPTRKSAIFPRGPRVGAFDAVMRQSTPQEKSKIFLVGTPNSRSYSPLPDALIWMQNKEKAPAQGASVLNRTCSVERVPLTQLCAK